MAQSNPIYVVLIYQRVISIAKAMYSNNLIKSTWNDSQCSNGLNAMLLAWKLYQNNYFLNGREPVMIDIIKYNEIDCKVLILTQEKLI